MRIVAVSVLGLLVTFLSLAVGGAAEPAPIPKEAIQEMEYRVGEWDFKLSVDGVEQPGTAHEVTKWCPSGPYCLIVTQTLVLDGGKESGTCIVGWDPDKKQLVERWYSSNGMCISYFYHINKEKDSWIGTFTYADSEGQKYEGKSVVRKKSQDEWVWEGSWTEEGKQKTMSAVNRRVKK